MKRKLLLAMFIGAFATMAKAEDRVLKVLQTDGQVTTISLNDEPRTTYADGNLVITTSQTTITYPLEKVRRYTYESLATGISTKPSLKTEMSQNGEALTFTGLKSGETIMLYNTAGQILRRINSEKEGATTVSVADLPAGVYVVKLNDVTYKITKR